LALDTNTSWEKLVNGRGHWKYRLRTCFHTHIKESAGAWRVVEEQRRFGGLPTLNAEIVEEIWVEEIRAVKIRSWGAGGGRAELLPRGSRRNLTL